MISNDGVSMRSIYILFTLLILQSCLSQQIKESVPVDDSSNPTSDPSPESGNDNRDNSANDNYTMVFDWNNASNLNWPGWTYSEDADTFGGRGFSLTGTDPNLGNSQACTRFPATRSSDQNAGTYGTNTLPFFDTNEIAPSTNSGSSLRLTSNNGTDNQVSWWLFNDCRNFMQLDMADETTDRLDFYIKIDGMQDSFNQNGGTNYGFHVGTYNCYGQNGTTGLGQCPYEGPGNTHFYHYFGFNTGAWIHAQMDRTPNWMRSGTAQTVNPPPTDPTVNLYNGYTGYYANMNQFYIEVRSPQAQQTTVHIDEVRLSSTKDSAEPNQNERSVTSLWIGYWPDRDQWQISWTDQNQPGVENTFSTFEIRYSTEPITNSNWDQATPVTPLYFTGPQYESHPSEYAVRSTSEYENSVWTAFHLPNNLEQKGRRLHFAIKDITVPGGNGVSVDYWPFNRTDGVAPPNDYIRTIDYIMP